MVLPAMNLWLRLIWIVVSGWWAPRLVPPQEASRLSLRVWLNDLDPFGHMNNGRYLTLMDLGRVDFMMRSGLGRAAYRHRWTPIASAVVIRFRREMHALQTFTLVTRLLWWDERQSVIEQLFVFEGGAHHGQIAAQALFKGGLYDRRARQFVPVVRLMEEVGLTAESPPMDEAVAAYLKTDEALRARARETRDV